MDPIAMTYYAVICGALSLFGPSIGGVIPRILAGIFVGMIAAASLPWLKGMLPLG